MRVFSQVGDESYRPAHSFFNGSFTPYPEIPERTRRIETALRGDEGFHFEKPPALEAAALAGVHDPGYLQTLSDLCARLKPDEQYIPAVLRRAPLLLKSPYVRIKAGYYALDTSTPLISESYATALDAAAVAHAGAEALRGGERLVYALLRPPGHHAGRAFWAGYCLVNNAALAAELLAGEGRVAVVDVDYHHGNGTQDIFYERDDVLYASLHCRPEEEYPYVSGTSDETGTGAGLGTNRNFPLPGGTGWKAYAPALESALEEVARFRPSRVVVSLGFDTLRGDPIGRFGLEVSDFHLLGDRLRELDLPLLIVQEGGYAVERLGDCALAFFAGLGVTASRTGS